LGSGGLFVASAMVLFITFWIVYGLIWFIGFSFRHWLAIPNAVMVVVSMIVVLLLFIGNARTDREYLSEFSITSGTVSDQIVVFYLPGVGVVSNANPLSPDYLHNAVKMITDISFSGPRLAVAACRAAARAKRLRNIDAPHAAEALAVLLSTPGKVAFSNLLPQMGKHDPLRVFPPLHDIEGIVFLHVPPQGMSLTADLRQEFMNFLRG